MLLEVDRYDVSRRLVSETDPIMSCGVRGSGFLTFSRPAAKRHKGAAQLGSSGFESENASGQRRRGLPLIHDWRGD